MSSVCAQGLRDVYLDCSIEALQALLEQCEVPFGVLRLVITA